MVRYESSVPMLDGERESQIIAHNLNDFKPFSGYSSWLSRIGISGEGITIAICDTGIDMNHDNNTKGHPDIRGRQVMFVDYTDNQSRTDTVGHGTFLLLAFV